MLLLAGCTSAQNTSTLSANYAAPAKLIKLCSGFGCAIEEKFSFNAEDNEVLRQIMGKNTQSPADERASIALAIGEMEKMTRNKLRFRPDQAKANARYNGIRGQMDCVDESLNTTSYLFHLKSLGLLKHHNPDKHFAERGLIIDGRYPHKSATMRDASGKRWTVDSWYRENGQSAQIMEYAKWRQVRDSFDL